jgi:phage-related minor tail protein
MDGIIKVLKEEAEDNVSSDVEKFKQDISRLKQEKSDISEKHNEYISKLVKEQTNNIKSLDEKSKKEKDELKEKFKKDKEELEEQSEKEKKILKEKIEVLERVIDGTPLTDKEIISKLQEKIKELENTNVVLKNKLPFWKR